MAGRNPPGPQEQTFSFSHVHAAGKEGNGSAGLGLVGPRGFIYAQDLSARQSQAMNISCPMYDWQFFFLQVEQMFFPTPSRDADTRTHECTRVLRTHSCVPTLYEHLMDPTNLETNDVAYH
jgi:hypothetical protein